MKNRYVALQEALENGTADGVIVLRGDNMMHYWLSGDAAVLQQRGYSGMDLCDLITPDNADHWLGIGSLRYYPHTDPETIAACRYIINEWLNRDIPQHPYEFVLIQDIYKSRSYAHVNHNKTTGVTSVRTHYPCSTASFPKKGRSMNECLNEAQLYVTTLGVTSWEVRITEA